MARTCYRTDFVRRELKGHHDCRRRQQARKGGEETLDYPQDSCARRRESVLHLGQEGGLGLHEVGAAAEAHALLYPPLLRQVD